ncbi:MAG: hypothetical protein HRT61_00810 [Ekhidna sp.]|nr:hypothetical protein [Ekhidna sp.]
MSEVKQVNRFVTVVIKEGEPDNVNAFPSLTKACKYTGVSYSTASKQGMESVHGYPFTLNGYRFYKCRI